MSTHCDRCGNHPLIVKYNTLRGELEALDNEIRQVECTEDKEIQAEFSYISSPCTEQGISGIRITATPTIRFLKQCEEQRQAWGSLSNMRHALPETRRSVFYSRINSVLITLGGGWNLLKRHTIVLDEDWKALLLGKVPTHLLKGE